jgi:radical SAM protein with 4Fe4S-binding SPASM domain
MEYIKKFNVVWISLTYNCNNRCRWCYTASNVNLRSEAFIPEMEEDVINLLSSLNVKRIILIGGEPTLYKNIEGIINKISNKGIVVGMVSNGRKFKDKSFSRNLKKAGLNYLTISIHGHTPEIHDSITGIEGSFYETLNGIRVACEEGINVSTNTVIEADNMGELEKLVNLFEKEKINEMSFNIRNVCLSEVRNNSQILPLGKAAKVFENIYFYAKSKGIKVKLVTPIPLCLFDLKLMEELKMKKIISGGPCQMYHGKNFVIEYNGNVIQCTHLNYFPIMNIFEDGKVISKEKFLERYNDPKGIGYTVRNKIRKYPSNKCENCNERCVGGCPLLWKIFDPEKEIRGKC